MSHWRDEHDNDCAKLYWPGLKAPLYLEQECWACQGKEGVTRDGKYPYEDGVCCICKGKGYALTDAGGAVLALLKRWGNGR